MCGDCYLAQWTSFCSLPQPILPPSRFFLHHFCAFLSFVTLPFEPLFTTWMACNLLECLFLHCLHPHSSPSSSMPSLAILWLYNPSMRSIVWPICLCSFLESPSKSARPVSSPTYPPHCTDPFLPSQITLSVFPSPSDVQQTIPGVPDTPGCLQACRWLSVLLPLKLVSPPISHFLS